MHIHHSTPHSKAFIHSPYVQIHHRVNHPCAENIYFGRITIDNIRHSICIYALYIQCLLYCLSYTMTLNNRNYPSAKGKSGENSELKGGECWKNSNMRKRNNFQLTDLFIDVVAIYAGGKTASFWHQSGYPLTNREINSLQWWVKRWQLTATVTCVVTFFTLILNVHLHSTCPFGTFGDIIY